MSVRNFASRMSAGVIWIAAAQGTAVAHAQSERGEPNAPMAIATDEALSFSGQGLIGHTAEARIDLIETAGANATARVTPVDETGAPLGGGRVVVLLPHERRVMFLAREFPDIDLARATMLVEVLRGPGEVRAHPSWPGALEMDATPTLVRAPRRRLDVAPPSMDLIDQAETSGRLDHETSVLYRVYVIFGDARLPAAYRGNDSAAFESLYLATVQSEWNSYSSSTQAALRPFLIPPAYSGSWATPAAARATSLPTDLCGALSAFWSFAENPDGKVRVWYQKSASADAARAAVLATSADIKIWPDIFAFMTPHEPLSDAGLSCNGGSGRLDIYLSDIGRSVTSPVGLIDPKCNNTPAYISLNRSETASVLAHEIFHAFQYSFPLAGCLTSGDYNWWAEGSAQWVMDKVFPTFNREQPVAQYLINQPEMSFDVNTDPHRYSTYLLPFYYCRKTGSAAFVKRTWENCQSKDALNAFNTAVAEGWDGIWPEFVLHNWNTPPVDQYLKWDGLVDSPSKADLPTVVVLSGAPDKEYVITVDLPKLSAKYEHYLFSDATVRSVAFWNGATFDLQKTTVGIISPSWEAKPASAGATEGVRLQALVKIKDVWSQEDWTSLPGKSYCRDVAAERIQELVLIISNSQFFDAGKRAKPPGLDPRLSVSNIGCYRWKGTGFTTIVGDGTTGTSNVTEVTWTREPSFPGDNSVHYTATGFLTATASGICNGTSGPLPIRPSLYSWMQTFNYAPVDSPDRRAYFGQGIMPGVTFGVECSPGFSDTAPVPQWFAGPGDPFKHVSPDGTRIHDTITSLAGTGTFTVDLTSQPEP